MDDYQRRRWMRPNAELWMREDAHRYRRPDGSAYVAPVDGLDRRGLAARKFSPDQPRDSRGRWVDESGGSTSEVVSQTDAIGPNPAPYLLAAGGRQSAAYCWNQFHIDELYCASLRRTIRSACRSQAMERYSACITGKPIPPLPF
jgi:hypothetical protein